MRQSSSPLQSPQCRQYPCAAKGCRLHRLAAPDVVIWSKVEVWLLLRPDVIPAQQLCSARPWLPDTPVSLHSARSLSIMRSMCSWSAVSLLQSIRRARNGKMACTGKGAAQRHKCTIIHPGQQLCLVPGIWAAAGSKQGRRQPPGTCCWRGSQPREVLPSRHSSQLGLLHMQSETCHSP